jgi:hypothetical protein
MACPAHTEVLILVTATTVTVISKTDHHVIASHTINPDRNYWPNQQVVRIFFTGIKEPPAFPCASGEGFVGRVRVTSLLV